MSRSMLPVAISLFTLGIAQPARAQTRTGGWLEGGIGRASVLGDVSTGHLALCVRHNAHLVTLSAHNMSEATLPAISEGQVVEHTDAASLMYGRMLIQRSPDNYRSGAMASASVGLTALSHDRRGAQISSGDWFKRARYEKLTTTETAVPVEAQAGVFGYSFGLSIRAGAYVKPHNSFGYVSFNVLLGWPGGW